MMTTVVVALLVVMTTGGWAGTVMEEVERAGATTALSLLRSVGLDTAIDSGYYTLFLPTNAAFESLPQELQSVVNGNQTVLRHVLEYHVVRGIFRTQDAFNDLELQTLEGQNVRVNVYRQAVGLPAVVTAEGRRLEGPDLLASNGYVHLVSSVLLPPTGHLAHVIAASSQLSTFMTLLTRAGIDTELTVHQGTVLAPTNAAFEGLETAIGKTAMDQITGSPSALREVLLYHILDRIIYGPGAFNGTYPTTDMGTELEVSTGADGVTYINHARVILGDIAATNGVLHVLDKVLMPPKYVTSAIGK